MDGLGVGARDEGTEHRVMTGPAPLGEGVALGLLFASATSCLVRAEVGESSTLVDHHNHWSACTTSNVKPQAIGIIIIATQMQAPTRTRRVEPYRVARIARHCNCELPAGLNVLASNPASSFGHMMFGGTSLRPDQWGLMDDSVRPAG